LDEGSTILTLKSGGRIRFGRRGAGSPQPQVGCTASGKKTVPIAWGAMRVYHSGCVFEEKIRVLVQAVQQLF
jgi:hypothetical protein